MGGEGTYTAGLHNSLSKLGHNVTTLVTDLEMQTLPKTTRRSDVIFVPTLNIRQLRLLSFYLRANTRIREIAKGNCAMDVIHYTNDYGGPILSGEDIHRPVIVTMHHPYADERGVLRSLGYRDPAYFFMMLLKFTSAQVACRKATKIIAVSKFTAGGIVTGYGVPPDKITIIPDGVDTNRFNPGVGGDAVREQWKLGSEPLIVFVGRLVRNKGLHVLLKAFMNLLKEAKDAKLAIVGEETKTTLKQDKVFEELMGMIKKFNLHKSVKLVGKATEEDLPKIYAAADLVVLPSLMEGFGMVLLEAMATAKPCVATQVGGIPEVVIDGKTGILVPPNDSLELYKAISAVLEDKLLSRKLGQAGRQRVENKFSWNIVAKDTAVLYEQALEHST